MPAPRIAKRSGRALAMASPQLVSERIVSRSASGIHARASQAYHREVMFPKNAWYVASWAEDLVAQPVARRICNEPIVLYRDASGRACALIDRCCHRGAPLSAGRVSSEGLQCGYHGLVFA